MEQINIENLNIDVNKKDGRGRTELHFAALRNDISRVKLLLSQGADVNAKNENDRSPLHFAVNIYNDKDKDYYEVVETLLKNGALVDAQEKNGEAPLHSVASKDNYEMVLLLLNFGADVNIRSDYDSTPLHQAAYHNRNSSHLKVIELLLKNGADVSVQDRWGSTPLHSLAKYANYEMISFYLNFNETGDEIGHRVDINIRDTFGCTPFFYLVKEATPEMMKLFLSFKADVNIVNDSGCNLLFPTVVHNKNTEVLQLLINLGLDVNHHDKYGDTPLHTAAKENKGESHMRVIEVLLNNGADVHAINGRDRTALYYSAKYKNLKTFQLILSFKANIDVVDDSKQNLLFAAACNDTDPEILKFLIDFGLNLSHRNDQGETPLHLACKFLDFKRGDYDFSDVNFVKIIKCLLKSGNDVNAFDNHGYTPLFSFVRFRYGENEKLLRSIIEQTDFNVIHNDNNILTHQDGLEDPAEFCRQAILKHLANLEGLNVPVHPTLLNTISEQDFLKYYYDQYKKELLRIKNTKLLNSWITFYNLLTDGRKKLKNYAGNTDLIKDLKEMNIEQKFPDYGSVIAENVKTGIKRRELFDESSVVLSNCWPIFNPNHLIIRDVLDCILSKKDLSKFCM